MATFVPREQAALHFNRHVRTIDNWISAGYIRAYKSGPRSFEVDLDEVERAIQINPRMRDGRQPFGSRARIVTKPVTSESGGAS